MTDPPGMNDATPAPTPPPTSAPAPAPTTPARRTVRIVAALVAAMLVGGGIGAVFVPDTGSGNHAAKNAAGAGKGGPTTTLLSPTTAAPSTATTAEPTTVAPVPPAVAAVIHQLMSFVEKTRGLTFKHDVPVELLNDAQFKARLAAGAGVNQADATKTQKVLHALGLLPANTDVAAVEKNLTGGAVIGLYDPKTKSLLVRGADLTPLVRMTLVHELTHALQDQWFGLDRPDIQKRNDESPLAFSSLIEGDAVRVQEAYLRSLSTAEQGQVTREEQSEAPDLSSFPQVLVQLLYFPYTYGPRFVTEVLALAGQSRLDAAFANPPTTTSQILHPDRFVAGEQPVPVPQPAAGGTFVDNGPLGELGFVLMLSSKLDAGTATSAADGWAGDNYAAYDVNGQTCVKDAVVMDNANDTAAMQSAIQAYARRRSGVTIQGGTPYQFTVCG